MLRSIDSLGGYTIRAKDGDIGQVDDFLFDDQSWAVRYLVVNTGNWLVGRKVIVLPAALETPDWETEMLTVNVSKGQIENSPPLAADQPVSRQKQAELHQYYGWPMYWTMGASSFFTAPGKTQLAESAVDAAEEDAAVSDPHLRSAGEVTGYHIQATDGRIGQVEDFIVEDETWLIQYLVVDTHTWLPGRKVLVAPTWIEQINWELREVRVDLKRETIKHSPEFDPSAPVNREYEMRLYDYYGRPHYWARL
ncbi:MAG: PRC-barrel domain containing protein [Chloroflexi bacterium]|nr:PRC-barrel domain containing protein [Chloroflexota bacterium]